MSLNKVKNANNGVQLSGPNSFKAGMKKSDAKTNAQKSIFEALDKNGDGVLSKAETQNIGVKGKVKNAKGEFVEKEYVKLKDLGNGRSLVADKNGKQWIRAHDGVILKQSYVNNGYKNPKPVASKNALKTANFLAKEYNSANKSFNAQMEKDGWAGDLADGISRAWTWATDSKNSANYVRDDLKNAKKNVQDLQKAAKQGQAQFNAKFKQIYGVNYNQQAMDAYMANPTEANYKKAFGNKVRNIKTRVDKYNKSQDTGAVVVKTTAKVGAGVTIGVATGGAGFVALGTAAAATTASSVLIEETDAMKVTKAVTEGKVEFREGTDHAKILKDAAWDGAGVLAGGAVGKAAGAVIKGTSKTAIAGRAATNVTGDVTMGAAQEYAETGEVTTTGVITNAAMSGGGSVVVSKTLNGISKVKQNFSNSAANSTPQLAQGAKNVTETVNLQAKSVTSSSTVTAGNNEVRIDAAGNVLAGGLGLTNSGPGFLTKMKNKIANSLSNDTPAVAKAKADSKLKNNKALDYGLQEAISDGSVDPNVLNIMKNEGSNASVSDANIGSVASDALLDALSHRKNGGGSKIIKLNDNVDISNISSLVDNGGVCSVKGELFVNNNGKAVPIKMSDEKFDKLFDPIKLATMQQDSGTHICVATSQINSMLQTPAGKARLFSMLEDTGDGIIVKLGNGQKPVFFPGGQPAQMPGRFMSNAPDGIKMIEQAFMVNNMKKSSGAQITDISTLSAENLGKQATDVMNRRSTSDAAREIGGNSEIVFSTKKGNAFSGYTFKENVREDLENLLNDFKPGQDVMVCHWSGHARAVVNYDPATQIVTYRDPMSPGVDTQCTFNQFMNKGSHDYGMQISLQKQGPGAGDVTIAHSTDIQLPTGYKDAGTINLNGVEYRASENKYGAKFILADGEWINVRKFTANNGVRVSSDVQVQTPKIPEESNITKSSVPEPEKPVNTSTSNTSTSNTATSNAATSNAATSNGSSEFISKTTDLSNKPRVVAHTAEGKPIGASITQTNVVIIKDGKYHKVEIPQSGEEIPVHESSTDTFLIIKNDNGNISITTSETTTLENIDNQISSNTFVDKDVTTNSESQSSQVTASKTKTPLEIPAGAKYVDTVTIMGKQCRRIKMPSGKYLTEYGGKWRNL